MKVEKDTEKAEEYYGRAILANPGDGELLSMYGKLIWETQRDEDRAKSYFDQAVSASPDNWYSINISLSPKFQIYSSDRKTITFCSFPISL